jgi:kinesin family protein 4/21/27
MIAIGASGSGKTFSMGLNNSTPDGIIGLSIDSVFQKLTSRHQNDLKSSCDFKVSISFIQIYKEKVFDMLTVNKEAIYSKTNGKKFSGSKKIEIQSSSEASEIIKRGNINRQTRSTTLNISSSRSHAIVTIYLNALFNGSEISSLMHFADLAGSEGLRRTQHMGIAQQEGVKINQGLLAVGKVVHAMSQGLQVIPYRDSTLTSVLQESLNINSYLAILGCISQTDKTETMSTVRFAQSVKYVKNTPECNIYLKEKKVSMPKKRLYTESKESSFDYILII